MYEPCISCILAFFVALKISSSFHDDILHGHLIIVFYDLEKSYECRNIL